MRLSLFCPYQDQKFQLQQPNTIPTGLTLKIKFCPLKKPDKLMLIVKLPSLVNNGAHLHGCLHPTNTLLGGTRQEHSGIVAAAAAFLRALGSPRLEPSHITKMERSYTSSVPSMEIDMMAQFLGAVDHCFTYEHVDESMEAIAALFLPTLDTDSNSSSSCLNYDFPPQCWPQPDYSSSVTSLLDPTENFESFEFPVMDPIPAGDFDSYCAIPYFTEDPSSLHGKHSSVIEEAVNETPATKKRKASATTKGSKKSRKASKKDYIGGDAYVDTQSSSSCTSEDGNFEGNTNSSSNKTCNRASRGAATDPQSLYARKRRERINERLRILQNLVPNGTKVDISTMLEEAAQYVKFLQLQIQLLSSDDMWMYAPIAYNGINISNVDLNIPSLQK